MTAKRARSRRATGPDEDRPAGRPRGRPMKPARKAKDKTPRLEGGDHACVLCRDKAEIIPSLLACLRKGLADGRAGIWVCPSAADAEEVRRELKRCLPGLARLERSGRLEVLDRSRWLTVRGPAGATRLADALKRKTDGALAKGFSGLVLVSDASGWPAGGPSRASWERALDAAAAGGRVAAVCARPLTLTTSLEALRSVRDHSLTLVRQGAGWTRLENPSAPGSRRTIRLGKRRFREIFDRSPVGIGIFDPEGRLAEANPACLRIFGIRRLGDVRGSRLFEDLKLGDEILDRLRRGKSVSFESRFDFDRIKRRGLFQPSRSGEISLSARITALRSGRRGPVQGYIARVRDVTRMRESQAAAEEAERRVRLLFESEIIGISIADEERILDANKAFLKLVGRKPEEIRSGGLSWRRITPPPFKYLDDLRDKSLRKRGTCPPYEKEYVRPDGTRIPVLVGATRLKRSPLQWISYVVDISDRKRAEEARRASEAQVREHAGRLQTILDTTPTIIWIAHDPECRRISGNAAASKFLRVPHGTDMSKTGDQPDRLGHYRVFENGREVAPRSMPIQRVAASGRPVHDCGLDFRFEDGSLRSLLGEVAPLLDAKGRPAGAVAAFVDVTERRKYEEALAESERRYRTLFREMTEGFAVHEIVLDKGGRPVDYRFLDINPAFERLTGLTRAGVVRRLKSEVLPDDDPYWVEIFGRVALTGQPVHFENYSSALNRHYEVYAFRPTAGQFAVIFVDVTARKKMEEDLRSSEARHRHLFESMFQGVVYQDAEGRIIAMNEAASRILGQSEQDFLGETSVGVQEMTIREDGTPFPGLEHPAMVALRTGKKVANAVMGVFNPRDFSYHWINISAVPIFRPNEDKPYQVYTLFEDITQRRLIEEELGRYRTDLENLVKERTVELARTNEFLGQLFAGEGLVLAYLDRDLNFIRVSRDYARLVGQSVASLAGRNHFELFPEERAQKIFRRVLESGRPVHVPAETFPGGGTLFPVEGLWDWSLQPVKEPGGRITGLVVLLTNVTQRHAAEEQLKASSLYARRLIEASLDPLVTISPEGKVTDVNKATEQATGIARERLIGSDFSDYFTDPDKAREGYKKAFSLGSITDYPLSLRRASGELMEVLYNATVYRDEKGAVQGVFATARDVTARKKAEEDRLRLAKALEQAAEGVVIMDSSGAILYANSAFEHMTGLPADRVVERKYNELPGRSVTGGPASRPLDEALSRGEAWSGRFRLAGADGADRDVEVVISPITDPERGLTGFVAIERDVTEETRLQTLVRRRQRMEALGTLAGGVAHDFNNILMPILINAELALEEKGLSPDSSRKLEMVLEAAQRGRELVRQIIAFSRQKDQEKKAIEIGPLIQEAVKFLRASIPRNVEIRMNIAAGDARALADPTQVHQVLMNLCSNAAHAMRDKGGTLDLTLDTIEVGTGPDAPIRFLDLGPGAYVRLTVADSGMGMPPDVLDKIFDPFFTTKEPGEGTGMGLAVVHGIVKNHGGEISVWSQVGQGTTFSIYLPRVLSEGAAAPESREPAPGGTERIIFLDDEEIHVRTIVPMLSGLGYRVTGMTDPRQAFELIRQAPAAFDLLVTDQTMPHMTGTELAGRLKSVRPGLPIILCTGYSDAGTGEPNGGSAVRTVLMKPFSVREIAEAIRRALDSRA
jgi:PAS domain S-box-containing protein